MGFTSIQYVLSGFAPTIIDHTYLLEESILQDGDSTQIAVELLQD
ncbi:MAG: hypothetical protein V4590_01060 [Bacteroidota bacterium]